MPRPTPALLLALATVCVAPVALAAEFSPVIENKPAAPVPSPTRVVSPNVAELLAIASPKYTPPPEPATTQPPRPEPEKPRNGIIGLPAYEVREKKMPEIKERDLLTRAGRLELAYKRHPGLRVGSFGPLSNNVWAKAMLDEEFAIERQKEM